MKSLYLNGLQIHSNSSDIGFVVYEPIKGLEFPAIRMQPYDKAGEHGSVVPNQFYGGRTIQLTGRVSGATPAIHYSNRRSLSNACSIIENSLNIATPLLLQMNTLDGLNLQTSCYVTKQPEFTEKSLNHSTFLIELYCPDPNLYDQSLQSLTLGSPSGGGVVYPVIYPVIYAAPSSGNTGTIANSGDSYMFPVVNFNGPLTSPYLTNLTTGVTFQISYTFQSTDVMVVDMANKTMLLNGITNAMPYFNINNTWLALLPGNNAMYLGDGNSSDTGHAQIFFRNSYIGL